VERLNRNWPHGGGNAVVKLRLGGVVKKAGTDTDQWSQWSLVGLAP